ncbi:TonB-dependent receptor plug domain-containing protein [Alteromonas sp. S167]|uniref:TonB-dependent receptor plug domain-containing protein n=1 Tax=Alteromonas sp. S167 TaxID=3117402 RepID=UPI002FE202F9
MYIKTKLARAVRVSLLLGAASTALSTTQLYAQETEVNEQEVEKIAVTGSRIKSAELASASPLQILDAGDIQAAGVANIQDLLLENPAFGSPAISRTNSNFSTASAGVSTIDLRSLGTARTLVLVNGRRFVSGVPGSRQST